MNYYMKFYPTTAYIEVIDKSTGKATGFNLHEDNFVDCDEGGFTFPVEILTDLLAMGVVKLKARNNH